MTPAIIYARNQLLNAVAYLDERRLSAALDACRRAMDGLMRAIEAEDVKPDHDSTGD